MAFTFDEENRRIEMPLGDTADIDIGIDYALLRPGDALIFAIFDRVNGDVVRKAAEIVDGRAHVRLCNHDTRDLEPGTYRCQLRIVSDPGRDADGNIIADDCTDDVISIFDDKTMLTIRLIRGGAYV